MTYSMTEVAELTAQLLQWFVWQLNCACPSVRLLPACCCPYLQVSRLSQASVRTARSLCSQAAQMYQRSQTQGLQGISDKKLRPTYQQQKEPHIHAVC